MFEYKIDQNMKCLLVDDDEIQENIISFDNAIFKYLVNIDVIYSVIDNLNQQQQNPSDEEYIFAFKHYIENDAFIDLERTENHCPTSPPLSLITLLTFTWATLAQAFTHVETSQKSGFSSAIVDIATAHNPMKEAVVRHTKHCHWSSTITRRSGGRFCKRYWCNESGQ